MNGSMGQLVREDRETVHVDSDPQEHDDELDEIREAMYGTSASGGGGGGARKQ